MSREDWYYHHILGICLQVPLLIPMLFRDKCSDVNLCDGELYALKRIEMFLGV